MLMNIKSQPFDLGMGVFYVLFYSMFMKISEKNSLFNRVLEKKFVGHTLNVCYYTKQRIKRLSHVGGKI